ncbi:MAG TPA: lipoprotein insertase outer membrane protein LolB [Woeseiaceae bacterium]
MCSPRIPEPALPERHCRRVAAALLLLALAGCATQRGVGLPDLPDWEARRDTLTAISEWEFQGRIGVSAGEDGFNGKLRWWQHDDVFMASVSGPLGVGTVKIQGDDRQVAVTDEDGEVTEMQDAESELYRRYGWTIPVTSLRYWALGIPDPSSPAETAFDGQGHLTRLEQRNWVVQIDEYRDGGGQQMPRRMSATHRDTRVRLVIDTWVFY